MPAARRAQYFDCSLTLVTGVRFASLALLGLVSPITPTPSRAAADSARLPPDVLDIGSRRELFVDGALVGRLSGEAELRLHHPVPQEEALVHDAPWEGSTSTFHTTFKDGDRYRMYYSGAHLNEYRRADEGPAPAIHPEVLGYAESTDGINWQKPDLGLYEFQASKANNISLPNSNIDGVNVDLACPMIRQCLDHLLLAHHRTRANTS